MEVPRRLLLIGCGKMGSALLSRALTASLLSDVCIVEPGACPAMFLRPNVTWVHTADDVPPTFLPDIILIAVKPQVLGATLKSYQRFHKSVFVSIVAGVTLSRLDSMLTEGTPTPQKNPAYAVVRAMPNLPASVGQGMTVAVANSFVTPEQHDLADDVMKAVGHAVWIDSEAQLAAITALSGSGPAYVFALCEVMALVGGRLGLDRPLADLLARQTIIGAGALLAANTTRAEDFRRAVTSSGGTTEAALKHLLADDGGLLTLLEKSMQAAATRAEDLANG